MLLLLNTQNRHQPLLHSLLSINLPIFLTQSLTYPFLKLQSQLLSNTSPITLYSIKYHFQHLLKHQGYPKILQGIRYSLDHSITYSTLRFLLLDQFLQGFQRFNLTSLPSFIPIFSSVGLATLISQPSLVQRTVASSLTMTDYETITKKMKSLDLSKVATSGMKYSIAINILSTSLDLTYLYLFQKQIHSSISLQLFAGVVGSILISAIIHPLHHLRVIEINEQMLGNVVNKTKTVKSLFEGVGTSILRRGVGNSMLFGTYLGYNLWREQREFKKGRIKDDIREEYERRADEEMRNHMRREKE